MQFPCPTCSATLSLPDDSPGKNAQCPSCQAVFRVPATAAFSNRAPSGLPTAIIRPGRNDAVACPGCDKLLSFNSDSAGQVAVCPSCQRRLRFPTSAEFSGNESAPLFSNPRRFGESIPTPVAVPTKPVVRDESHPYAAPPLSSESFRPIITTNYTTPGWCLFGVSAVNFGFDLIWTAVIAVSILTNPMNADAAVGIGFSILWGAISLVLHGTSLLAGLRITQRRSLTIARVGAIFALIPCGVCSVLQVPFGIWALIAVYGSRATLDFTE